MRVLCFVLAAALSACAAPSPGPAAESGVAYTLVPHASGAEIPEVSLPDRPAIADAVNAAIAAAVDPGDCQGENAFFDPTVTVPLAQDDVLSVEIHLSYFCGGAYPTNDANVSMTFDLKTGEPVALEDLFAEYAAAEPRVRALYLAAPAASLIEECESVLQDDAFAGYGFAYALQPDGLVLQPEFPHVVEACADRRVIPYASLRGLLAAGGIAARVAR